MFDFIYIELLVTSYKKNIGFYDLTNLKQPRLIKVFKLENISYSYHGMICTKCKDLNIEILLFGGGRYEVKFPKSFTKLSIILNSDINLININDIDYSGMNENIIKSINHEKIENINIRLSKNSKKSIKETVAHTSHYSQIGFNSIINSKNERIIIVIGGSNYNNQIVLYNVNTNTMMIRTTETKDHVCIY